jgi:hypothetical protein
MLARYGDPDRARARMGHCVVEQIPQQHRDEFGLASDLCFGPIGQLNVDAA